MCVLLLNWSVRKRVRVVVSRQGTVAYWQGSLQRSELRICDCILFSLFLLPSAFHPWHDGQSHCGEGCVSDEARLRVSSMSSQWAGVALTRQMLKTKDLLACLLIFRYVCGRSFCSVLIFLCSSLHHFSDDGEFHPLLLHVLVFPMRVLLFLPLYFYHI